MRANHEWAMDFIVDGMATWRMLRILSGVEALRAQVPQLFGLLQDGQELIEGRQAIARLPSPTTTTNRELELCVGEKSGRSALQRPLERIDLLSLANE
jgi:hypothetical protein